MGTVPGTVPRAVRKASPEAFPAAIYGWSLAVTGRVSCWVSRKGVRRLIRAASRYRACGAKGEAIATATRRETRGAVRGETSEATLEGTREMRALGPGTRTNLAGLLSERCLGEDAARKRE
jgi:hypothetical protein